MLDYGANPSPTLARKFHTHGGFFQQNILLRDFVAARPGIRSRAEIDREIYALKILRGDFDAIFATNHEAGRIEAALTAVGL
jgi:hypothetical protein